MIEGDVAAETNQKRMNTRKREGSRRREERKNEKDE